MDRFDENNANYVIQQTGMYAIDYNIILDNLPQNEQVTTQILSNGSPILSSINTIGTEKTISTAELIYLSEGSTITSRMQTQIAGRLNNANFDGGYSIYFLNHVREAHGKSILISPLQVRKIKLAQHFSELLQSYFAYF